MKSQSRRRFLKGAAAVGSVPLLPFISRTSWAQTSPMQRVQHVGVGVGGKGWSDINPICSHEAATLVAGADVDKNALTNMTKKFPDAKAFGDWREMFANTDFDSVSVSTPDHMHGVVSLSALAMGKHCYTQKPLASRVAECRRLSDAARETGLVTQMGNQLASSLQERMSVELLRMEAVGKIKEVHIFCHKNWGDDGDRPAGGDPVPENLNWDQWLGIAEERPFIGNKYYHPGNWRRRVDFGTGALGDMGCHIFNAVNRGLELGSPLSVEAEVAVPNAHNWATKERVKYVFGKGKHGANDTLPITWHGGSNKPPKEVLDLIPEARRVPQGSLHIGTEGAILVPHGSRPYLLPEEKFAGFSYPKIKPRDHYLEFVDCIVGKQEEAPISNFIYAGPMSEFVLLGCVASQFGGKKLEFDGASATVKNLDASSALDRTYRAGFGVMGADTALPKAASIEDQRSTESEAPSVARVATL